MTTNLPGQRRLLQTWLILMVLTGVSMIGALIPMGEDGNRLAWTGVLMIIAAAYYKAHRIVMVYLNLRASSPGWKGGLIAYLMLTTLVILGSYMLSEPGFP
ncbi:cytochrome c oxidase subunit IV [Halospina denitrificans]|uniref:Cytochrome c oxidase subunit IV n=1 Tax=Halospina denitrificans TaxID=332522 RepID=A0A4R7JUW9_9GAMM|nr:cytochrome C oxidase subunit IV family protein [Halospina denitrificans]TDT41734.1 cytochrome c oxidase subunit IV [Halospina denitrificans]